MSAARRILVTLLILFLLAGHLVVLVKNRELWPFSQYPMYAGIERGPTRSKLVLTGVVDGEERRLEVRRHLAPFDPIRLGVALGRLPASRHGEALAALIELHEYNRARGRHDDDAPDELRLYRQTWNVTADGVLRTAPDGHRLLLRLGRDEADE